MSEAYTEDSDKLLVFSLGGQKYALYLSSVMKVVEMVEISPLPKAPEIVLGVINFQGLVIPVFNIRKRFRVPEKKAGLGDKLIIARTSKRPVALVMDEAGEVIESAPAEVTEGKNILPDLEYVEGVIKLDDGMVFIHDLGKFLSLDEKVTLDRAMNEKGPGNHD